MEAYDPSLWLRRGKLSRQYAIRIAANPSNPAFEVTFPPQFSEYYEKKKKKKKTQRNLSFGIRIAPLLNSSNINIKTFKNALSLIFHPGALLNQLSFRFAQQQKVIF